MTVEAHIVHLLVDSLIELVALSLVGARASLDPLPKLLQHHLPLRRRILCDTLPETLRSELEMWKSLVQQRY
jgi:hypothetical protein